MAKFVDPTKLIFISRSPDKVPPELVSAGVTVRKADYDLPETLEHVFDGVSYLLLVSYPSIEFEHRFEVWVLHLASQTEYMKVREVY